MEDPLDVLGDPVRKEYYMFEQINVTPWKRQNLTLFAKQLTKKDKEAFRISAFQK